MASEIRVGKFDDTDREAASYLLDKFWILRDREPEMYQLIREREQKLRDYFFDKCGFHLIMHREFVKLEKIPACGESWMGIEEFKQSRDYVLLCCLLAYLEAKSVDEQFLLSDLCETLLALYPANSDTGVRDMSWESYECRKSLVRVLAFAADLSIISKVDGEIGGFSNSSDNEVLFEVPIMSRYFLRSYPKDLFQFSSKDELMRAEYDGDDEQLIGRGRKCRVYRQLLLSPVFDKQDAKEEDFLYLRNLCNRLREDIETHTFYKFELYANAAMLTVTEKKAHMTVFPNQKGISEVILHFATLVRGYVSRNEVHKMPEGMISLTPVEFNRWAGQCKEETGSGWSKEYRDMSLTRLSQELLAELMNWKMARMDDELGLILLSPLLGRTVGNYPVDYQKGSK